MPRGRKVTAWSKIKPKLEKIQQLASEGYNEKEIYTKLGLSCDAFYKCKKEHPELDEYLTKGREQLYDSIESKSVYKLALGGIKTKKQKYVIVEKKKVLVEETVEESLPYFPAAQFVLEKKRSKVWGKTAEPTDNMPTPKVIIDVAKD
jgi:hypothetical protein